MYIGQDAGSHHCRDRYRFEQPDIARKARTDAIEDREQQRKSRRIEGTNTRRRRIDQCIAVSRCQSFGEQYVPGVINHQSKYLIEPQEIDRQTYREPENGRCDVNYLPLPGISVLILRLDDGFLNDELALFFSYCLLFGQDESSDYDFDSGRNGSVPGSVQ